MCARACVGSRLVVSINRVRSSKKEMGVVALHLPIGPTYC